MVEVPLGAGLFLLATGWALGWLTEVVRQHRAIENAIAKGKALELRDTEPQLTEKQQRGRVKRV